jgi:hypothetical protein
MHLPPSLPSASLCCYCLLLLLLLLPAAPLQQTAGKDAAFTTEETAKDTGHGIKVYRWRSAARPLQSDFRPTLLHTPGVPACLPAYPTDACACITQGWFKGTKRNAEETGKDVAHAAKVGVCFWGGVGAGSSSFQYPKANYHGAVGGGWHTRMQTSCGTATRSACTAYISPY